jgi:hypothetical protein
MESHKRSNVDVGPKEEPDDDAPEPTRFRPMDGAGTPRATPQDHPPDPRGRSRAEPSIADDHGGEMQAWVFGELPYKARKLRECLGCSKRSEPGGSFAITLS